MPRARRTLFWKPLAAASDQDAATNPLMRAARAGQVWVGAGSAGSVATEGSSASSLRPGRERTSSHLARSRHQTPRLTSRLASAVPLTLRVGGARMVVFAPTSDRGSLCYGPRRWDRIHATLPAVRAV